MMSIFDPTSGSYSLGGVLRRRNTLYERRFGESFKGPEVPFGSIIEYYPISANDQSRLHQFGKTSRHSVTLTIHWNLAHLVKNYPGIIVRQHTHRSETNGIAERAVRRIKEGTSAVLSQSGLDEKWWADSVECCCCLRNVQDLLGIWENTL